MTTPEQQLKEISVHVKDLFHATYGIGGFIEDTVRKLDKSLNPPKPKGWIDPDNLPEVGTVLVSDRVKYQIMKLDGKRFVWLWIDYFRDAEPRYFTQHYDIDHWNSMVADGEIVITAVHPPEKSSRPKIALSIVENGVRIDTEYGFIVIRHPTPTTSHKSLMKGLQRILKPASTKVEVIQ